MKFKINVSGTSVRERFEGSVVVVKVRYECKLKDREEEYRCELPLTAYNLARPI